MAKRILDYLDHDDKRGKIKGAKALFQTVFDAVIEELKLEGDYEVSLSLVSKDEIHALNREYRKIDAPTDVLTFAYMEADFLPDEPVIDLGSILICKEIAEGQAKKYNHPYKRELAFLFIHGLLHSLGYDHMKEKEAEEMFALQNKILNNLDYDFYTSKSKMIKELKVAHGMAMADYSNFKVGAVVVTKDGKYHRGFNIENASYPLTCCAERVALFSTYAKGYHKEDIVALGLVTSSSNIGSPCGACRQVISELMNVYCPIYIYSCDFEKELIVKVEDLLPYAFTTENLKA